MKRLLLACLLAAGPVALPARAEVSRIEISTREPYANGERFGERGPYQRLRGRVYFAVDPKAKPNRGVVDLSRAPRNRRGRVEFSADLEILAPTDLSRANGTLLYDVNNRGGQTAVGTFNGGDPGFLMRQGYVVVSSGWIGELLPGGGRLLLEAPIAREAKGPIRGRVRCEISTSTPADRLSIAQWGNHGSYPPVESRLGDATLTERLRESDPRVPIPRSRWRLESHPVAPGGTLPQIDMVLEGGFQPGRLYEFIYEAEGPLVQGLGLAGIRDLVSYLKYSRDEQNPLRRADGAPAVRRSLGFGVSQSGRCLRQFLYDGFNADEKGRIVFDALMPHVAGAGLGSFNHRFASPTRHSDQHDNHTTPVDLFPFTYGDETDPFTGRRDGLLRRARTAHTVPKVFHVQTSAEYWHRAGSLVHTDPEGKRDAVIPEEVRIYAIGGAQHGAGNGIPGPKGAGQLPANPTDYRPVLRALLVALDQWVAAGKTPPPSRYPHLSDGTLAGWRENESGWRAIAGVRYPEVIHNPEFLDFGPEWRTKRRITQHPPLSRGKYGVRVPAYGADDNERGMLLLPSVAAPVATFTGWNLRAPETGAETELLSLTGGYIPFPTLSPAYDPRPPLVRRYPSFDAYLRQYTDAMETLIRERYLLERDREGLLNLARKQENLFPKRTER